jgi:hypothetical protein
MANAASKSPRCTVVVVAMTKTDTSIRDMYKQPDQLMTIRFASFRIMLEQHLLRNFRSFCGNGKKVSTRAHCARITLPNFLLSECSKQMVPLASGDACHLSPHFKENMQ